MLISTEIGSISNYVGEEKAVEFVAKAGFDAWDFSMFKMGPYDWANKCLKPSTHPLCGSEYLAFARKLRSIGEEYGIHCNQSHAPFPTYCADIRNLLKRAIECTAEAGGTVCVIHPDNYKSAEENKEMFLELLPFAKEYGVKMATENMWNWSEEKGCASPAACSSPEDFIKHVDAVNDPFMVACLDIGHAEMFGVNTAACEMIEKLDYRLQALHIHDNDLRGDSHNIPFSMKIDFNGIVNSLKKINYKGYLTLEADSYIRLQGAKTEQEVFECVCRLADSAKRLNQMF